MDESKPSQWTKTKLGPSFTAKVEAHENKKYSLVKTQAQFQGRRFRFTAAKDGVYNPGPGPFRVNYFLYNPFAVFDDKLNVWSEVREKTNIRITRAVAEKTFRFQYEIDGRPTNKTFEMSLKASAEGWLQSISIVLDEKIDIVLQCCDQLAGTVLDSICFSKQTPIDVHHVDISRVDTGELVGNVMVMPYTREVEIEEADIIRISQTPKRLDLLMRTFREAINCTNPSYQLLCLWSIYDALNKVRGENHNQLSSKPKPKRPRRRIPDNELTRAKFATWIDKSYEEFFRAVQKRYRHSVAHLVRDDPKAAPRNYALVQEAVNMDLVNCMQISMLQQLIVDEWTFMAENNLT